MTTAPTVKEWTAYRLASEADCASPDSLTSEGARMLEGVRDACVEACDDDGDPLDRESMTEYAASIADDSPSLYTSTMWGQFVDLGGYLEDPSEFGSECSDMDHLARICLYMIAERCAQAVLTALADELTDA